MLPVRPYQLVTPVDHAHVLHPAGRGRVTLARRLGNGRWRETSHPVGDLAYVVRSLGGEPDIYLTQNRFFGRRRLVSRLAELNALFVDLDYYKTKHAHAHPRHVLDLAVDALERARIPLPGFAVATGRGIALVWLHRPVPRQALPRWQTCQQVLIKILGDLGADRLATDAARVLRLVGTRNSCSGTLVEAIGPVGQVWDFDDLADEVLPKARADLIALRLVLARRRREGQNVPLPARRFTVPGLWELRLGELQELLRLRWFGLLPPGQRDVWMLLAGVAVSYLVPDQMVFREIRALAGEVTGDAWDDQETRSRMSAVIRRAGQAARGQMVEYQGRAIDPRYRFTTETIIELLDITEVEMRAGGFRHLVTPEIRREQHRLREEHRRRAAGQISRADYEASSLSRLQPWEAEGISRATWYRHRETSPCRCMVKPPAEGAQEELQEASSG